MPFVTLAGTVARLAGASEGSLEVTEGCSCPRKGCSKASAGKPLKPDAGQPPGVMPEQELRALGEAGP